MLLARLTEKTKNVTVALDCCHAAHMTRDDGRHLLPKAYPRPVSYDLVAGHLDGLQRRSKDFDLFTPPSNPWAVRIVACAPQQSAYEYDNAPRHAYGHAHRRADPGADRGTRRRAAGILVDRHRPGTPTCTHLHARAAARGRRAGAPAASSRRSRRTPSRPCRWSSPATGCRSRARHCWAYASATSSRSCRPTAPESTTRPRSVTSSSTRCTRRRPAATLRLRVRSTAVPLGARAYQTKAAAAAMPVRLPERSRAATALARQIGQEPAAAGGRPGRSQPGGGTRRRRRLD